MINCQLNRKLFVWSHLLVSHLMVKTMAGSNLNEANPFSVAFVTVPSDEVAKTIARGLVTNKLAACVNIIPGVTSIYLWKGEVNEDSELILKIKTRTSLIDTVTDFVKKNHPYEVCEVISLPIVGGNKAYLAWINDVVAQPNKDVENKEL